MFLKCSLNNVQLRMTACFCMLLDHIGFIFLTSTPFEYLLRLIGRIAFPLFCFLLVEGYVHTRDFGNYVRRILNVGLLSQLPYSLLFGIVRLNVMFQLLSGLFLFWLLEHKKSWTPVFCLSLSVILFFSSISEYGLWGLLLLLTLKCYRDCSSRCKKWGMIAFFCMMISCSHMGAAVLAVPLMACYNGRLGRRLHRVLEYGFYPAHMFGLYLLCCI